MFLKTLRFFSRAFLGLIADVEKIGEDRIPQTGGAIVVSNHVGRLDALLAIILSDREDIIMMVAEKYRSSFIWRYFGKKVDAIWLNRFEADFHAMREVHKRLQKGGILALAPEGTRSPTGTLMQGKPGAAFLAAKAGVPIIPLALIGTEDAVVKSRLKHFKRLQLGFRVGKPIVLPPMGRQNRDAYLEAQTEEIMCQIAALLPPSHWGVYANHPRLKEILASQDD